MPFGTTIGGTPLTKAFVGNTPVKRIYTGTTHVWPPLSTKVTWIGSTAGTGTTNTYAVHTAGDLLVALVVGTSAAPSGYTVAATSTTGTTTMVAYKWATGANTSFGTFTGAQASSAYVFRNADTTTPLGAIQFASGSGLATTAPALTLTDPSGASAVAHTFYNAATAGAWVNKIPANFLGKNQQARMANNQMIDTRTATTDPSTMTHSVSSLWSAAAIEVLAPQAPARNGLYGVKVEYGDNYDVTFTALTSYAADPNEAFFFRSTPMTNDGYTARTFTKTYRSSAVPMDCTLEEYWATPSGVRNTINFQVMPKAVGGAVEEIIP
jgi:hypothetical protein